MIYDEICKRLKAMSEDKLRIVYHYVLKVENNDATSSDDNSDSGNNDGDYEDEARKERESLTDEDVERDDQYLYDHADEILNYEYATDPKTGKVIEIDTLEALHEYLNSL